MLYYLAVIVGFCVISVLVYLLYKRINNKIYLETMPLDIMSDFRRNFEILVLGSTRIWACAHQKKMFSRKNQKEIVFALPTRSLEGDFHILQRMHSYLKQEGTVFLPIDLEDSNNKVVGIGYAEINLLHRITLDELNICCKHLEVLNPLIYYKIFSWIYLYTYCNIFFAKVIPWLPVTLTKKSSIDTIYLKITECKKILYGVADFCKERDLNFMPVFILPRSFSVAEKTLIIKCISESYLDFSYNISASPKEALELVSTSR